jgi:hypothetical protein
MSTDVRAMARSGSPVPTTYPTLSCRASVADTKRFKRLRWAAASASDRRNRRAASIPLSIVRTDNGGNT